MSRLYFIKTCVRDREWMAYLLRSLAKFDPEAGVFVAWDADGELGELKPLVRAGASVAKLWPEALRIADPYIRQQYIKLTADRAIPGEHIQLDSDCFMLRTPVAGDFIADNGYRIWFFDPWDRVGQAECWRAPTERALNILTPWEHMRRPGFLVTAELLEDTRRRVEDVHRRPLVDYLAAVEKFSEYNVLGAWLHTTNGTHHCYTLRPSTDGVWGLSGSPLIEQGWSRGPLTADRRRRYEQILAG